MKESSTFIIVKHFAIKARTHYDLRFKMPNSKNWASFACRKEIPKNPGPKVLAVRTHDHSEKEALYLGRIKTGEYGAGELKKWDDGKCEILKYTNQHIIVVFNGRKINGLYHFVNTGVIDKKYKERNYMLFKGKEKNE